MLQAIDLDENARLELVKYAYDKGIKNFYICPGDANVKDWIEKISKKIELEDSLMIIVFQKFLKVYAAIDVYRGFDLLYDGEKWISGKYGVFTEKYIVVSDYYGYPDGALFSRIP